MNAVAATSERTFIAGLGASGALVAAAGLAAALLIAIVTYTNWPQGGNDQQAATVDAAPAVQIAPAAAASAGLAPAATAVAATPAPVVLASADDPDTVVVPGNPNVPQGTPGSVPTSQAPAGTVPFAAPTGSGAVAAQDPSLLNGLSTTLNVATGPVTQPLLTGVGNTTNQLNTTVYNTTVNTPVSGVVGGVSQILGGVLGGLGSQGNYQVPQAP